jgi:hypothetical protein
MARFRGALPGQQQFLTAREGELGGVFSGLGGLYHNALGFSTQLGGIGQDVRGIAGQFGQFAQGLDPALEFQRQQQLNEQRRGLARQGVTGTVAQNEFANTNQRFTQAQLQNRNQNLLTQAGLFGQEAGLVGQQGQMQGLAGGFLGAQAGVTDQRAGMGQTRLQNELIDPTLLIGAEAAQNAGQGGGGGGGGFFNTVICTLLHERGDIPSHIYWADVAYGAKHINSATLRGYHLWARPLVELAKRNRRVYNMIRPLGYHWAHHMAYLEGAHGKPDYLGAALLYTIKPLCTMVGRIALKGRVLRRRWAIIPPGLG